MKKDRFTVDSPALPVVNQTCTKMLTCFRKLFPRTFAYEWETFSDIVTGLAVLSLIRKDSQESVVKITVA